MFTRSIARELFGSKKLFFRLPVINHYLLATLLAGIFLVESIFYVQTAIQHRIESSMIILDPLLPSKNIDK